MNPPTSIFVIDNYDSFTFNLVHLVEQLNCPVTVRRNDAFELNEVAEHSHVLISPGPGLPSEAGNTMAVIAAFSSTKSIFGVCLGMQAMLENSGAQIENMPVVEHGARSIITCEPGAHLFRGLPERFPVGRYHSWAFQPSVVPEVFQVTARSEDGYVMAVEHRMLPLAGVQFHPESIMTEGGLQMLRNWLWPART